MTWLWVGLAQAADLRTGCQEGDQDACDQLLVITTAQVAAAFRGFQERGEFRPLVPLGVELRTLSQGAEAVEAARDDHVHGHVDSARFACAMRGRTDGVCAPLRWSELICERDPGFCASPSLPRGWEVGGTATDTAGVSYGLLEPSTGTWRSELVAGPLLMVRSDAPARWLPQPWCHAAWSDHEPPQVIGVTGARCDTFVRVSRDGEELERTPLPEGATRVWADDAATWVGFPLGQVGRWVEGRLEDVRSLAGAEVTGLLDGEPVQVGRESTAVGDQTFVGACQPAPAVGLWCDDDGLVREVIGGASRVIGRSFPSAELDWPTTLPTGGDVTVHVLTEPGAPAVLLRRGPTFSGDGPHLAGGAAVVTALADAEGRATLGPVPASADLFAHQTPVGGAGTWIVRPRRAAAAVSVVVIDGGGRPVEGAEVLGDTRARTGKGGRASVVCRGRVQAFSGEAAGAGTCAEGERIALVGDRPVCRLGSDVFPCDTLAARVGDVRLHGEQVDRGWALTPLLEVDPLLSPPISLSAERLGGVAEGTRLWLPPGPIDVRTEVTVGQVEHLCATGEVSEAGAHIDVAACQPLERRVVVDRDGTPVHGDLVSEEPASGSTFYARSGLDGAVWVSPARAWSMGGHALKDDGTRLVLDVARPSAPIDPALQDMQHVLTGVWRTDDRVVRIHPDGEIEGDLGRGRILRTWTGGAQVELDRDRGVVIALHVDELLLDVEKGREPVILTR